MAALLAGARLIIRQGLRYLPACGLRPAAVPVRCFSSSARFLTTAVQDKGVLDLDHVKLSGFRRSQPGGWSLHYIGKELKRTGRISKEQFFATFEEVIKSGIPSRIQTEFFLQTCGSSLAEVPHEERTRIADTVWKRLQELGVVFDRRHYNILLKIYLENEHTFSPTEFLAGMEASEIKPDQTTYEGLIEAYCNEGDIQGAGTILGFMKNSNFPITEGVFSSLITGHARSGDMEGAKNILSVMQDTGIIPGRGTYAALLCAFAEKGDFEGIKQTLKDCKQNLTDRMFLKVIYSLAKGGHTQFVHEIFEHMTKSTVNMQEVTNLCLKLLTQGREDTALQIAKRFIRYEHSFPDFMNQPFGFFIRHCVHVNMPTNILTKYAAELKESNLIHSPLQFALFCALDSGKKDMAFELMRALKEEGLPVKPHYCWPLLAFFQNEKNVQGSFQVLRTMQEMDVELDLDTFTLYVASLFENVESPETLLQENGFQKNFNKLYLTALKAGILSRNLKPVYNLLLSKIPLVKDQSLKQTLTWVFQRSGNASLMAQITKLLYYDGSSLKEPSSQTESVSHFLYNLIDRMSDSEIQEREEHLKQYFNRLKEMGVTLNRKRVPVIELLESRNISSLSEVLKSFVSFDSNDMAELISSLEKRLESRKTTDQPFDHNLKHLLRLLIEAQDQEKVLKLKSTYGSFFTLGMCMRAMSFFCENNNPTEALKMKELADQRGFSAIPTTAKYTELVNVLAMNGFLEDAINILKEMQERNVAVDSSSDKSFFYILHNLASKGDVDGVNQIHEHVVMLGLAKPTPNLCSPLMLVHLNRDDVSAFLDASLKCYEKYKCCPLEHLLLLKLVEMGETDLLKKAVDHISNTLGERAMLHSLIFVFIETGKYAEAQKIAETPGLRAIPKKMKWIYERFVKQNKEEALEKSLEITRSIYECDREEIYFQLLTLYDKNNDWVKAAPLWYKMKEEELTILNKTMDLFRNIFAKNNQDISAHIPEFEIERDQDDKRDNERSRKVSALCMDNNINEAYSVFLETVQDTKPLSKSAYSKLIRALLGAGRFDEALKVEEVTKSHFSDYSIKHVSWSLLLAEKVRRGCLKDAIVTLEIMFKNGSLPGRVTMNKLTTALAMEGNLESLKSIEDMITNYNVHIPKIDKQFFYTKALAHFVNGNFEEATSMIESHFTNDPRNSLNDLFLRLIKSNMTDALEKVSIMVEKLANQFSIYRPVTELFFQYLKLGRVEEAKQLLQRCSGILEQTQYIRVHINRQIQNDQNEYVYKLLDVLYDPYFKQVAYNYMMKHFAATHKLDDAVALYEKMKAEQIKTEEGHLKRLADLLREANMSVPFPEPQESVQSSNEEQSFASSPSESEEKH